MAGVPWSPDELAFIKQRVTDGVNPRYFRDELNTKFGHNRTQFAIENRLTSLGISFAGTGADPDSEDFDQIVSADQKTHDQHRRIQSLETRYQAALKNLNIQEKLIEWGDGALKSLPLVGQPKPVKPGKGVTTESGILLLSDTHIGEVIQAAEMRGLNAYNVDICNRRLKHLSNVCRDLMTDKLRGYHFDRLHIMLLGDIVSGYIHDELAETGEGNIMDWTVNGAYIIAQLVREFLQTVPAISLVGVVGNHGRVYKGPVRFKERYVNWDYVTYQYISMFLRDEAKAGRVTFNFPQSFWTVEKICGWNWLVLHGDNIKSWAGIPWYGIERAIKKLKELMAVQKEFVDYIALGHFHNQGTLDMMRGQVIINGSVMGGDEYSIGKMYSTSSARQWLGGIHPRTGITWTYNINLQDAEKRVKETYKTADLSDRAMGEL